MQFIINDQRIATENFEIGLIYTVTFTGGRYFSGACIGKGADFVMFQRTAPELVYCLNMTTAADVESIEQTGGGGGTLNYNDLFNKPQINGVELSGNKSLDNLGIQAKLTIDSAPTEDSENPVESGGVYSALAGKQDTISDLSTIRSGAAAGATAVQPAAMETALDAKQNTLTTDQLAAVNSGIDTTKVAQIETNKNNITKDEAAIAELVDSGAKNLMKNTAPYGDNVRTNITFTHNTDDTYTITGISSNTLNTDFYIATNVLLKSGTYKLIGCPTGGDNKSTYKLQIAGIGYDSGDGFTFTIENDTTINVYIRIWGGYVPNNLIFKPMICTKAAWDISHAYQPYRPSYQEIYERVVALEQANQ